MGHANNPKTISNGACAMPREDWHVSQLGHASRRFQAPPSPECFDTRMATTRALCARLQSMMPCCMSEGRGQADRPSDNSPNICSADHNNHSSGQRSRLRAVLNLILTLLATA